MTEQLKECQESIQFPKPVFCTTGSGALSIFARTDRGIWDLKILSRTEGHFTPGYSDSPRQMIAGSRRMIMIQGHRRLS